MSYETPVVQFDVLPCCSYDDPKAIMWNPFNRVVQCHNCGQVWEPKP